MDKRNVLITGIGGNVGQGIIRNIKADFENVRIVGCNVVEFTAGNHLCEAFYKVPYADNLTYVETINDIVKAENIDLIIPSTDLEVYYLSLHAAEINTTIATSGIKSAGTYLDKYLTFLHHQEHNLPFATSCLPSVYNGAFQNYIVKPRKGRGSRGLHINPLVLDGFSDDEYMVQEMHYGQEITTAFYVDKQRQLHGLITMSRELENGATSVCKVIKKHDDRLIPILKGMIEHGDIKGAANLQSIVTNEGDIIPFEINCRISGTNSIRGNFGFKDVKYTVQEYLHNTKPETPAVTFGIAARILMDVVYPEVTDYKQCVQNQNYHIF